MYNRGHGPAPPLNVVAGAAVAHASLRLRGRTAALLCAAALLAAVPLAVAVPHAAAQDFAAGGAACREGLEPIMRNADGMSACVSPGTKAVLIERGWGSEPPAATAAVDDGGMPPAVLDESSGSSGDMAATADSSTMDAGSSGDMAATADSSTMDAGVDDDASGAAERNPLAIDQVDLTEAESARLSADRLPVRVAYDFLRIPIEFYDDSTGILGGMSASYLAALEDALGADLEPIDMDALMQAGGPYEAVRTGAADMMLIAEATDERRGYMSFTAPHTTLPIVMVATSESPLDATSLSGMDVGAVSGYGAARWLDGQMPGQYTGYPDAFAAVAALGSGEIDVVVGLWPTLSYAAMAAEEPVSVYNAGETGQATDLSVGYASSDAALGSALEKAVAAVPDEVRSMAVAAANDPLAFLTDPSVLADAVGDNPLSSMVSMGEEIDAINNFDRGALLEKVLGLPEANAFVEKHGDFDEACIHDIASDCFYDFGMEIEMTLTTLDKDASLRVNYDKEADSATFVYTCTLADGNPMDYAEADLATAMADLCG